MGKFHQTLSDESPQETRDILLPHLDLIFKCACRMAGRRYNAEDLAQETFYFAIKHFSQLKDHTKAKSWLFSILRNLFLKEIERSKKHPSVDYDVMAYALAGSESLEQAFSKYQTSQKVREHLETLETRLRRPLELFYFEMKSYKEIASELGLPMGTVMSRIARAKVQLKRVLHRSGQDHW